MLYEGHVTGSSLILRVSDAFWLSVLVFSSSLGEMHSCLNTRLEVMMGHAASSAILGVAVMLGTAEEAYRGVVFLSQ
ncbi:hypothetical protein EDB19DRAFT_1780107 [Suillus lakei]|nr:hypothetical protein EDB19DRAFT_1780107 [Suillus lakei]